MVVLETFDKKLKRELSRFEDTLKILGIQRMGEILNYTLDGVDIEVWCTSRRNWVSLKGGHIDELIIDGKWGYYIGTKVAIDKLVYNVNKKVDVEICCENIKEFIVNYPKVITCDFHPISTQRIDSAIMNVREDECLQSLGNLDGLLSYTDIGTVNINVGVYLTVNRKIIFNSEAHRCSQKSIELKGALGKSRNIDGTVRSVNIKNGAVKISYADKNGILNSVCFPVNELSDSEIEMLLECIRVDIEYTIRLCEIFKRYNIKVGVNLVKSPIVQNQMF